MTDITPATLARIRRAWPLATDIRAAADGHVSIGTPAGRLCIDPVRLGTLHSEIACVRQDRQRPLRVG